MTREDAIKKQKDAVEVLDFLLHEFEKKAKPRMQFKRIRWALGYAIECVKKQIPKKPTFVEMRFRHHGKRISDGMSLNKCYKCPSCNGHIFHIWDSEKHCEKCGQALDWTEEGE